MDWLDLLVVQRTLKTLLQHPSSKASIPRCSAFFMSSSYICTWLLEKPKPWLDGPWVIRHECVYVCFLSLLFQRNFSKSSTYEPSSCNFQRCEHAFHHVRHEWIGSLRSLSCRSWSFSSSISSLQTIALLACWLNGSPGMPTVILYYCTFQGTMLQD